MIQGRILIYQEKLKMTVLPDDLKNKETGYSGTTEGISDDLSLLSFHPSGKKPPTRPGGNSTYKRSIGHIDINHQ